MKLKKLGVILSSIVISGFVLITSGVGPKVYAEIKSLLLVRDEYVNNFAAGVKISINEPDFPEGGKDDWTGNKTPKSVTIPNQGSTPALIRVAIVPRWVDKSNNPWPGDVSSNVVNIEYANSRSWLKDDDGYYYYKSIVPGGVSTNEIITSVSLNENIFEIKDGKKELKEQYKTYIGKTLIVDVKAEAVEASQDAYSKVWPVLSDSVKNMLNDLLG